MEVSCRQLKQRAAVGHLNSLSDWIRLPLLLHLFFGALKSSKSMEHVIESCVLSGFLHCRKNPHPFITALESRVDCWPALMLEIDDFIQQALDRLA